MSREEGLSDLVKPVLLRRIDCFVVVLRGRCL